ncbi:MAG TPA: class I SAM-dependent methyltransferase [Gammaproteobacteria bacterium]|nr:class I SAM-dependent methyltransferase [Gammaproteobacteria bacterium]
MDNKTQRKWNRVAKNFDFMTGIGPDKRWGTAKQALFSHMQGNILFLALGTGLDIDFFPKNQTITAIDISPKMVALAQPRVAAYEGEIEAKVMDVHDLPYSPNTFDQVYTSCTFCSVPKPVEGLQKLYEVLKPGGGLYMFEHTGSHYFPFNMMMHLMTPISSQVGPSMNRATTENVRRAGFQITKVIHHYLDVVKSIHAEVPSNI